MEAEGGKDVTTEVHSEGGSINQKYSYVLHGARVVCPSGSRTSRLQVPRCHGTYIHDMPIMTINDTLTPQNIQPFGFCMNPNNPDRKIEEEKIMKEVDKAGGTFGKIVSGIGSFLSKVKSIFTKEKEKKKDDYSEDLKNIMVTCKPKFAVNDKWENGSENLLIKGVKALNSGCTIQCVYCQGGGEDTIISIVDDGQENATDEQQGQVNFNEWKPGDPYPNPTKRNLNNLEKNIQGLEMMANQIPDGPEKDKILAEIQQKNELKDYMKDNINMLDDVAVHKLYCNTCEAPSAAVNKMEQDGSLQKMIKDGSLRDKDNTVITDIDEAKKVMEQNLRDENSKYHDLENTESVIKTNYYNGTPVVKMDKDKFQKSVNETVKAATNNDVDNQWKDVGNGIMKTTTPVLSKVISFEKRDSKAVIKEKTSENKDYSLDYMEFNGKKINEKDKDSIPYIYYDGALLSEKDYKEMVANEATKNYKPQSSGKGKKEVKLVKTEISADKKAKISDTLNKVKETNKK